MTEEDVQNAQIVEEQPQAQEAEIAEQQQPTSQEMNFKALREQKDKLERQLYERDLMIEEIRRPKEAKKGFFEGDKEDIVTKGEVEQVFGQYISNMQSDFDHKIIQYKYPNAQELISKYGNEVPTRIANALAGSKDLEAAIDAIKMTPSYIKDHAKEHINVSKAMENANKPKSTLNAGSTGAVSKASRYKSMDVGKRMALQDRFIRGYGE